MFSKGHRGKVASMRISPIVLLLFAMLGCGSGTESAKTLAKAVDDQAQGGTGAACKTRCNRSVGNDGLAADEIRSSTDRL